jgi:thiol-disulfide isomerase/thioredoxin
MDAVYVYIAEKYYIPEAASWSDPKFISDLKERVKTLSPLLIGKTAPDIELYSVPDDIFMLSITDTTVKKNPHTGQNFRLSQVKANYIIVYFWEAGCGHCKKSIPELHKLREKMKSEGVQVVAVSLLGGVEGKVAWTDFVNEHRLYDWINAWNPYDFSYKEAFDIKSSNVLYLLDKDKKILAKNISPEQAEQIITDELKRKKQPI